MALETMIKNLNDAHDAYKNQLNSIGKEAREAVAEYLAPLVPPGYILKWDQYTPYFNDGEPCTFSVNEPVLVGVNDEPRDEGWELGRVLKQWGKPDKNVSYETRDYSGGFGSNKMKTVTYVEQGFPTIDGWSVEKIQELAVAWGKLPDDLLLRSFGDHCTINIKSDGTFENDECSHD